MHTKKCEAEAQRSYAHAALNEKTEKVRESMRVTHLGFYLRVIVNEKPLYREKTTYIVLSVLLLIYDCSKLD